MLDHKRLFKSNIKHDMGKRLSMISPFNLLMTKQKQPIIYNQLQVEGTKMPWMLPQTNGGPSN